MRTSRTKALSSSASMSGRRSESSATRVPTVAQSCRRRVRRSCTHLRCCDPVRQQVPCVAAMLADVKSEMPGEHLDRATQRLFSHATAAPHREQHAAEVGIAHERLGAEPVASPRDFLLQIIDLVGESAGERRHVERDLWPQPDDVDVVLRLHDPKRCMRRSTQRSTTRATASALLRRGPSSPGPRYRNPIPRRGEAPPSPGPPRDTRCGCCSRRRTCASGRRDRDRSCSPAAARSDRAGLRRRSVGELLSGAPHAATRIGQQSLHDPSYRGRIPAQGVARHLCRARAAGATRESPAAMQRSRGFPM